MRDDDRHQVNPSRWLADLWDADGAACRGVGHSDFYPTGGGTTATAEAAIRRWCDGCPARVRCLTTHLLETHGVWGGTTEAQRVEVRRHLPRLSHHAGEVFGVAPQRHTRSDVAQARRVAIAARGAGEWLVGRMIDEVVGGGRRG